MTQYDPPYASSTTRPRANGNGDLLPPLNNERLEERGSLSGSEEGGSVSQRIEAEVEEDVSLTSQTLNADGTPKRPMNAFMIFARRRRPQVSAENQAMRTGEISKLLSKEWTSMPMSEKQFYLDQAKILKDNFNSKYPDYVYRRRPNNSKRKNRRGDFAGLRQLDNSHLDDISGHELGDSPHTDEEAFDPSGAGHYSRVSHEGSPYENHSRYSSRYGLPSDSFRDTRLQYPASDRLHQDIPPSRLGQNTHGPYSYPYSNTPSGTSSIYEPVNSSDNWQNHKVGRGPCSWPNSESHDRLLPLGSSKVEPYASTAPQSSWPAAGASSTTNNQFHALTTPFTPSQNNLSQYSSSPSPVPASHYEASTASHGSRSYESRPFIPSPSISPANYPARNQLPYPTQRPSSISRSVTSVPGISSFNHPGMPSSESSSSHGYWSRE